MQLESAHQLAAQRASTSEQGERTANGRASTHARLMELLYVTGSHVTLSVTQIASILALDESSVVHELQNNAFVVFDAATRTVTLTARGGEGGIAARQRSAQKHSGGVGRRRASAGGMAGAGEDGSSESADSAASSSDEGSRPAERDSAPEAATAGARMPPAGHRHSRSGPLSPLGPARGCTVADAVAAAAAANSRRPRGSKSGSRMGSRHPPASPDLLCPSAFPLAAAPDGSPAGAKKSSRGVRAPSSPGSGGGDDSAGAALATLPLSGRVGYVCVAEAFRLPEMETHYREAGHFAMFDLGVLHIRPQQQQQPQGGEPAAGAKASAGFDLFLFEYGAAVWWGADQKLFSLVEHDFLLPDSAVAPYMVNRYSLQVVNENYPVWCSYSLVRDRKDVDVDEEFRKTLRFDRFLIPYGSDDSAQASTGARETSSQRATAMLCCSHALAQSAKVDFLELSVQQLTEACSPLPHELRERGHVNISERRLLRMRGEVLSYRLMLSSGSDILDEPDFFWENAFLKPIFEATREGFGIDDRVEVLDNKLDAAQEILSMLADEFSQRHGARLEWIVIWLVFVEVIIGVLELVVDVRPWLYKRQVK